MKPHIMLIRAYGRDDVSRCIPWGIVNIGSYLKKYGYRVTIADRRGSPLFMRKILKEALGPDIAYVGISAMTTQAKDAEFLSGYFKKRKKTVILGGLHYSIFPQEGLNTADFVFKGEGERSFFNFLENGLKEKVYEPEPLLNLDDIPLPSEELLGRFYLNKNNFIIMTSRGCTYDCTFCLDKSYRSDKLRYHCPAYVCDLIEMLIKSFGIKNFFIADDIFTINKKRVFEICREIKKRSLNIRLGAFTHSGIDDLELYNEMRSAGFESVSLGVESGSDKVLKIMNKNQTVSQTKKTIEIIRKTGLKVHATFMLGNILETEQSLKATLELAKDLGLAGWISYAQPFPGTKFYETCAGHGKIINPNPKTYWNDRIAFIPNGLSKSRLKFYRHKIALVLKAPVPLLELIKNYLKNNRMIYTIYKKIYSFREIPLRGYLDIIKLSLILKVKPYYTMVSYQGLSNLYELSVLAEKEKLQGDFVECGVYRGGCAAIMAKIVRRYRSKRKIWLFDSFRGLPEPTEKDGPKAVLDAGNRSCGKLDCVNICVASSGDVVQLFSSLNLYSDNIIIKEGWFQETLPKFKGEVGPIAILRLDCDWYESTKCCLENLYDNVVSGGFIIIDDYDYWQGSKEAVNEFLAKKNLNTMLLKQVDQGCYYLQKP